MKKITAILLLLASLVALTLSVSAASPRIDVKKGTPTLDGKLDNLYLDSAVVELGENNGITGNLGSSTPAGTEVINNGKAYFLWDKDYLYMYAVVWDNDTLCNEDCIAIMFNINSVLKTVSVTFANENGSIEADEAMFDPSNCQAVVGTNTESKYHFAEIRIALTAELKSNLGSGKEFGFHWIYWNKDDKKTDLGNSTGGSAADWGKGQTFLKFKGTDAAGSGNATNAQGQEIYSSTAAVPAEKAYMTASGTTAGNNNNNNNGGNKNPQTADGIAVVGAVALCAAAAAVILIKKKRA